MQLILCIWCLLEFTSDSGRREKKTKENLNSKQRKQHQQQNPEGVKRVGKSTKRCHCMWALPSAFCIIWLSQCCFFWSAEGLALSGLRPFSYLFTFGTIMVVWRQLPRFSPHVTFHSVTSKLGYVCFTFTMISWFTISYRNCLTWPCKCRVNMNYRKR